MEPFVHWLYSTFPGLEGHLPPILTYLGLWAIAIFIVAVLGWCILFLIGSVFVRGIASACILFFEFTDFLHGLIWGKQNFPVIVEDRRYRDEAGHSDLEG